MPTKALYSLHPSVAYVQAMVDNLESHTGKSLEAWVRLLKAKGPKDEKRRKPWLTSQGLGASQASLVAARASGERGSGFADSAEGYLASAPGYVEQQYAGKKAALRPLYQALLKVGLSAGSEAKACPCQTFVPLFRTHVFAQLKPSTLTRIDLGLALGDPAKVKGAGARLRDTGGFAKKDRITHRLEIQRLSDVDDTVRGWLKEAYLRDG
jgi:hypothetical protein